MLGFCCPGTLLLSVKYNFFPKPGENLAWSFLVCEGGRLRFTFTNLLQVAASFDAYDASIAS